jgi:hypothetical protein
MGGRTAQGGVLTDPDAGAAAAPTSSRRSIAGLALAASGALLLLHAWIAATSPMNGEDYGLAMPLDAAHARSTIGWIVERCWRQASTWNARLGEQLAIAWLAVGKPAFVVANALCFAAFASLVSWYAAGAVTRGRAFLFDVAFAGALTLLAWPRLELFFWRTAAAGYLQPLVLTSVVALPFFLPEVRRRVLASRAATTLLAGAAALAGAAFENLGLGITLGLAGACVLARRSDPRGARWLGVVAACYALGWLALLLAPSTAARAQYYRDAFAIAPLSPLWLARRSFDTLRVLATTTGGLALAAAGTAALALLLRVRPRDLIPRGHVALALAVAPSALLVIFAPYTEARSFAGIWAVLLVLAVRAHHLSRRQRPQLVEAITVALLVVALGFGIWLQGVYAEFAAQVEERERTILAARGTAACETGLVITRIPTEVGTRLLNNREKWLMQFPRQVSRYYGCRLIIE